MEDDRVAILEAQVAQAKLIAEEADKKYEEVSYAGGRESCSQLFSPLFCLLVAVTNALWTRQDHPEGKLSVVSGRAGSYLVSKENNEKEHADW